MRLTEKAVFRLFSVSAQRQDGALIPQTIELLPDNVAIYEDATPDDARMIVSAVVHDVHSFLAKWTFPIAREHVKHEFHVPRGSVVHEIKFQ